MHKEYVRQFLKVLQFEHLEIRSGWINASCPFAQNLHSSGKDSKPSFGVKVGPVSHYNCFACGSHGDLTSLVRLLSEMYGKEALPYADALQLIADYEGAEDKLGLGKEEDASEIKGFPHSWISSYPTGWNHPYLKERGISKEMGEKVNIRLDITDDRIIIPVYDFSGNLVGAQGRDITNRHETESKRPKYLHLKPKDYHFNWVTWLGENWVEFDNPVVVVEGPFDCLRVMEFYANTICSMGSNFTPKKISRIKFGSEFITFFDGDVAGDKARQMFSKLISPHTVTHIIPGPGEDAGGMGDGELKNLLKQYGVIDSLRRRFKW